ncbi:MAG: hypothetical protein IJ151_04915 [Bacteroidales bacterium]|nr:hypothetical protein [Bacteroidales bacterium]
MKITKVLAGTVCGVILAASAMSCHHKSDDDTLEYMDGSLSYDLPVYMEAGTSIDLVPTGVTYGDDAKLPGIFWYTSENTTKDTTRLAGDPASITGKFTLKIDEDFVGKLVVTCSAFADGYYLRTQSITTNVINEKSSLVLPDTIETYPVFTDDRDGRTYKYTSINGLDWFSRNLSYSGGFPALGTELLRSLFGTFYTWDEARTACPDGWRLPGADDWKSLATGLGANVSDNHGTFKDIAGRLMTDAYFNSEQLWEFNAKVKVTGDCGFDALPTGYANIDGAASSFSDFTRYAVYWTAEEADEEQAYYRYLYVASPDMNIATGHKKSFAAPVRCVRESL